MKNQILRISLATILLVTPFLAWAQAQDSPPNRPVPRRQGDRPLRRQGPEGPAVPGGATRPARESVRAELGLTDAQQADVRKVVEGARRDRLRKSTDLKIARMDLQSLLRAEKVDEKAIGAKLAEMQAAQGALLKIRVDSALAMKRILTPEQQKKLGEVRRERGMGRPRPQMRGGRGFSPGREGDQEESLRLDPLVVR